MGQRKEIDFHIESFQEKKENVFRLQKKCLKSGERINVKEIVKKKTKILKRSKTNLQFME